jgi:exodeoxyribonuclease V alpha subunit
VLAGDLDQLASVDAGAVFADLCASGVAGIVRLERNYRQADAPHLVALAGAMRRGDASALADAVSGLDPPPMRAEVGRVADAALVGYETAVGLVEAGGAPLDVLAAYDRYRVLTALRDGEAGARGVNAAIAARLRRRLGLPALTDWYPGRLVMVGRNEPGLGLYNGDIGVCLPGPDGGLAVAFDAGGKPRWLPLLQMPACEDAFAITVHKSQGSEFETVALLPAAAGHPLNTRELIYTGITRARRGLQLWADLETLQAAAANRTQRHGRLAARLAAQSGAAAGNGPPGG